MANEIVIPAVNAAELKKVLNLQGTQIESAGANAFKGAVLTETPVGTELNKFKGGLQSVSDKFQTVVNPYSRGAGITAPPAGSSNPYSGKIDQAVNADPALYRSNLGTPVFADVTFDSVTYADATGRQITTDRMTFQAILISVSFPRKIIKTHVPGRNGTVKEYIGEDDAQINFRGVITGPNGHYPASEVNALVKIAASTEPIPVTSDYLRNLGIYSVIFEDRTLDQEEGGYSYQTFSLEAISDTPIELKISGI